MKTDAKTQLDLFGQASSRLVGMQLVISASNKPEILEVLALLLSQRISEQRHQHHKEVNHAR